MKVIQKKTGFAVVDDNGKEIGIYPSKAIADQQAALNDLQRKQANANPTAAKIGAEAGSALVDSKRVNPVDAAKVQAIKDVEAAAAEKHFNESPGMSMDDLSKIDPRRVYALGRYHALQDQYYDTEYSPMFDKAEELYAAGKYQQAAQAFEKATANLPDAGATLRAADAWAKAGQPKQANEAAMLALKLHTHQGGLSPDEVKYANDTAYANARNEAEPLPTSTQQGVVRPSESVQSKADYLHKKLALGWGEGYLEAAKRIQQGATRPEEKEGK